MKFFWLLGILLFAAWPVNAAPVAVGPDPRVDLLATVFRLAGNPEYQSVDPTTPYEKQFAYKFDPFKSHAVVKMAAELRRRYGVSYDAVMSYAVRLDSMEHLELLPGSVDTLDARWPRGNLTEFAAALQSFAKDTAFLTFFNDNLKSYDQYNEYYREVLTYSEAEKWIRSFFDAQKLQFAVVPCLLSRGGFGLSVPRDGVLDCSAVMTLPPRLREFDNLAAKQKLDLSSYLVHEMSHPAVNSLVDQYYSKLAETADLAYVPVQEKMRRQAYPAPQILMIETFNRAVNITYLSDRFGESAAQETLEEEKANGFELVPYVCQGIREERQKCGKDWSFEACFPQLVTALNSAQVRSVIGESTRVREQLLPKIVSVTPANNAQNVDPATKSITVVFDRPMRDKSWAVCQASPETYPEVKKISYDSSCKILTVEVLLQPDHDYLLYFNAGKFRSFISYEGYLLDDYTYGFRTGKAAAPAFSR